MPFMASTNGHRVAMLGTGLIGDFYTMTLHAGRGRDRVEVVYSRTTERGDAFSQRWDVPHVTTSIEDAVNHPDVDAVLVGVPNHLHEEAIAAAVAAGKPVAIVNRGATRGDPLATVKVDGGCSELLALLADELAEVARR